MLKERLINAINERISKYDLNDRYNFESCCENIDDFLYEVVVIKKNEEETKLVNEFIAENLDLLMKYTTGNSRWFRPLLDDNKFKDNFVLYIKNHMEQFKDDIEFIQIIALLYDKDCTDLITSKEFLNKLFEFKYPNDFYLDLYLFMPEDFMPIYIDMCIDNNIELNLTFIMLVYTYYKDYFISNFDKIINSTKDIFALKKAVINDNELYSKINKYIDDNEELVLSKTSELYIERKIYDEVKDIKLLKNILILIIKDNMKNENVKVSDIVEVGTGAYSSSLQVGDKIIKIGKRKTKKIVNNPYILEPLLRREFKVDNTEIFVEVVERVNTDEKYGFKQLYELYKKVRNLGLIWTDCTNSNVGRLLKDNKRYWRFDLQPTDEMLNLKPGILDTRLKKGELVILDSDYIFEEDDPNIIDPHTTNLLQFETKFQKELEEVLDLVSNSEVGSEEYNNIIIKKGFRVDYVTKKLKEKYNGKHI
jgi:hypothetical protein